MDFLIDTIREIESGKIKIDRTPKWIRSNVGTNNLLNKITGTLNHLGFSDIPIWYALYSMAANMKTVESSRVDRELTRLQSDIETWKTKYQNEVNDRLKDSDKYLKLYSLCKEQQKRIKELEGGQH